MSDLNQAPAGGSDMKTPILFGSVIALLGANLYLYTQLDGVKADLSEFRKSMQSELSTVKESSSVSTQTARRSLTSLKDELETARRQASMAVGQAKSEATKYAQELERQLVNERSRQTKVQEAMKTEFTQAVSEAEKAAQAKISEVSTEVGTVKTEVAAAKSEIDKTVSDLKRVTGDLGLQSGLIATNRKELDSLRSLGERNYFEFNLTKSKEPRKVGDVSIQLKRVDVKRNRFTIDLIADDKKVEKKDRNINEPVQFYVAKARQPYELVVNEVKKDQISGYLSAPKVQTVRN